MGRGKPAEGHAVPLSEPVQAPDAVDCRCTGAAEDRPADLLAGHSHQDVPALSPGRSHGEDAGLGGRRVRRLYAELTGTSALMAASLLVVAVDIRNDLCRRM